MPRCKGITLKGKQCKKICKGELCFIHMDCEPIPKNIRICIRHKKVRVTKKENGQEDSVTQFDDRTCFDVPRHLVRPDALSRLNIP
jgi:hypothetical protein